LGTIAAILRSLTADQIRISVNLDVRERKKFGKNNG